MLDRLDVTRTIPAWPCDPPRPGAEPRRGGGTPQLRLQVVEDAGDVLAVQVAEGVPGTRDSLLRLEHRGVFAVAAVLRREDAGGASVYLKLRAWHPDARGAGSRRGGGRAAPARQPRRPTARKTG
jgi:hypothetical protein